MRAIFNGEVIADSPDTVVVEGNHYFPRASLVSGAFEPTPHTTACPWKGTASYFTVSAGGAVAENAAWTYEDPKDAAAQIKDHVAFYGNKVDVVV